MDAQTDTPNRTAADVAFLGRKFRMYLPEEAQALALQMTQSEQVDDQTRAAVFSEMMLSLFVLPADRTWFMVQLASGAVPAGRIGDLLEKLMGKDQAADEATPKPTPRKRAARRS